MTNDSDRVLIIGGGFSGSALAIQLATRGIASVIVESRCRPARGAAYSTDDDAHLLNVPAGKMGLFPAEPAAFADHVEDDGLGPQDFVSRRRFGDYIEGELTRREAEVLRRHAERDRTRASLDHARGLGGRELAVPHRDDRQRYEATRRRRAPASASATP